MNNMYELYDEPINNAEDEYALMMIRIAQEQKAIEKQIKAEQEKAAQAIQEKNLQKTRTHEIQEKQIFAKSRDISLTQNITKEDAAQTSDGYILNNLSQQVFKQSTGAGAKYFRAKGYFHNNKAIAAADPQNSLFEAPIYQKTSLKKLYQPETKIGALAAKIFLIRQSLRECSR